MVAPSQDQEPLAAAGSSVQRDVSRQTWDGEEQLSELEREVLGEYALLRENLEKVSSFFYLLSFDISRTCTGLHWRSYRGYITLSKRDIQESFVEFFRCRSTAAMMFTIVYPRCNEKSFCYTVLANFLA